MTPERLHALLREVAAVRILVAYPAMKARWGYVQAKGETADAVNRDMALPMEPGGFVVTESFVHEVVYRAR